MWRITLLLLSSLYLFPVTLQLPAEENKEANRNALDILRLIEQALARVTSDTQGGTKSQVVEQPSSPPSQWPWIDSLLNSYVQSGTPENVSEGVASIILERCDVDEEFKEVVIRQFASSHSFVTFALQEYSLVKDGLLQWFVTSKDFRSGVLQDITCNEIGKLLKDFTSSIPENASGNSFSEDHSLAWNILQKWSEEDSCFRSALLGRLVISDRLCGRIEAYFSHSREFSKAVALGFISSKYFVESLVTEYTESNHLLNHLLHQLEAMETFRSFLMNKLMADKSFRQIVFEYLSTIELNATRVDLKTMVLKQAINSDKFRKALFVQVSADSNFKGAISGAFLAVEEFRLALIKMFASSNDFKKEVTSSQAMMDDALHLFKTLEFFKNAVLELAAGHSKVKMNGIPPQVKMSGIPPQVKMNGISPQVKMNDFPPPHPIPQVKINDFPPPPPPSQVKMNDFPPPPPPPPSSFDYET